METVDSLIDDILSMYEDDEDGDYRVVNYSHTRDYDFVAKLMDGSVEVESFESSRSTLEAMKGLKDKIKYKNNPLVLTEAQVFMLKQVMESMSAANELERTKSKCDNPSVIETIEAELAIHKQFVTILAPEKILLSLIEEFGEYIEL